jgi:hypothetical protein
LKKTFDAVIWMRKRRTEIDEEDRELTWEEKRQKTRNFLEKDLLWHKLRKRLVEPSAPGSTGTSRRYSGEHKEKAF